MFTLSIIFLHYIMISAGIFLISIIEPITMLKKKDYLIYSLLSILALLSLFTQERLVSIALLIITLVYVSLKDIKAIIPSSLITTSLIPFLHLPIIEEKIFFFIFLLISTVSIGFITKRVHAFIIVAVSLISLFTTPLVGLISSATVASIMSFYFRQQNEVCPFTTDAGLAMGGGFISGLTIILSIFYGWNLIIGSLLVLGLLLLLSGSMRPEDSSTQNS